MALRRSKGKLTTAKEGVFGDWLLFCIVKSFNLRLIRQSLVAILLKNPSF